MQFDKAIRDGLARQAVAPSTVHPDPDMLTAFLEQALSQPERQQILQHLSLCGDCRQVLTLAMPEAQVALAAAAAQPETSIWNRWLVVRWAAAAAAVIVVAGTVTLYRTNNQPHQMAAIVDGPAAIADRQARQARQTEPVAAKQTSAEAPKTETKTEAKNVAAEPKPAQPPLMADAIPQDRIAGAVKEKTLADRADQLAKKGDLTTMAKSTPPAAPVPLNTIAAQSPTLTTPAEVATIDRPVPIQGTLAGAGAAAFPTGNGQTLRASAEPPLQIYDQPATPFKVAAESQPKLGIKFGGRGTEAAKALARREPLSTMFSTTSMPNAPSLNRRWQVTPDGQLKRSHAIGDELHTVHVADGVFFKAVGESGDEVWVGGIGGALYHSTDDGKSWMKLMPSAGDRPLIADVVAIHATQRGAAELSTSNGERWITVDGGQHWARHD